MEMVVEHATVPTQKTVETPRDADAKPLHPARQRRGIVRLDEQV
ncbi:MAG TPA: hypothetical protein VGH20_06505 [Myxococcales bacterium]|jgi:hypothetical protein